MSSLVRESFPTPRTSLKWSLLGVVLGFAALGAFLLIPGSIASKTHLALHGICAQRPSHSLQLGGAALPLDARMTGLYLGAVASGLWLLAAGRVRSTKIPSGAVLAILVTFMIVLAADGFNALAVDLGLPHPYEPSNTWRLVTGVLGGTTLGTVVIHLLAATMWARGNRHEAVVERPVEFVPPMGIAGAAGVLALSGLPILYAPLAIGLVIAAVGVFAVMGTIVLALLGNRGWTCISYRDAAPLACGGLVVATIAIGALAWLRLMAEHWFGLSQLT